MLYQSFEDTNSDQHGRDRHRSNQILENYYIVAEKTGYIIFKDGNVIVLYCNHFYETLRNEVKNKSKYNIWAVRGLKGVERWMGTETIHGKTLQVQR